MDLEMKTRFEEAGVDVTEALERFMNKDELFVRFMSKFKDDNNLTLLKEALDNGNVDEAFKMAHTLKGVASNLSLKGILEPLVPIVETLRAGSAEGVKEKLSDVEAAYDKIMDAINTL